MQLAAVQENDSVVYHDGPARQKVPEGEAYIRTNKSDKNGLGQWATVRVGNRVSFFVNDDAGTALSKAVSHVEEQGLRAVFPEN